MFILLNKLSTTTNLFLNGKCPSSIPIRVLYFVVVKYDFFVLYLICKSTAHHISHNSHNRKLRSPWWNRTLRTLSKATRTAWNRYRHSKSSSDHHAYSKTKNEYSKCIRKSKQSSWQKFCSNISSPKLTTRILRSLERKAVLPTSLNKTDGSYTSTQLETLEFLAGTENSSPTPPVDNTPHSETRPQSLMTDHSTEPAIITLPQGDLHWKSIVPNLQRPKKR